MKNRQKGFIIPVLLGIIGLLVTGGGFYIYQNQKTKSVSLISNPTPTVASATVIQESLVPVSVPVETNDAKVLFPDKLGTYERYNRRAGQGEKNTRCIDFSKRPDQEVPSISGEVCTENISADYRDSATLKIVSVQLTKTTKGKDTFRDYVLLQSSEERFDGFFIRRIENHELGWFPKAEFDLIVIQESTAVPRPDGESRSYGKATGENPVMRYFLTKYPPQN